MIGTYVFYAIAVTYVPGSISESWMPSRVEMIWIGSTILIALGMALYVAVRLSRRILTPLNSVANSLREVAEGKLDARVPLDEQAIGETAQLVRDFNTMYLFTRTGLTASVLPGWDNLSSRCTP